MKAAPSYEDLLAQRQKEWETAQRRAEAELADLRARVAKMPDLANAPDPTRPWGYPGIECGCGSQVFTVVRWVTVNGVRYRAQLQCLGCKGHRTWDWADKRWIEAERFYRDA